MVGRHIELAQIKIRACLQKNVDRLILLPKRQKVINIPQLRNEIFVKRLMNVPQLRNELNVGTIYLTVKYPPEKNVFFHYCMDIFFKYEMLLFT